MRILYVVLHIHLGNVQNRTCSFTFEHSCVLQCSYGMLWNRRLMHTQSKCIDTFITMFCCMHIYAMILALITSKKVVE